MLSERFAEGIDQASAKEIGLVLLGWCLASKPERAKEVLELCDLDIFPKELMECLVNLKDGNSGSVTSYLLKMDLPMGDGRGLAESFATHTQEVKAKAKVKHVCGVLQSKLSHMLEPEELNKLLIMAITNLPNGRESMKEAIQ